MASGALSLTDEGDTFLGYARRLLETRDELASELSGKQAGPSGWVRLSVSPLVAREIGSYGRSLYAAPAYLAGDAPDAVLQVRSYTRTDNSAVVMALALQGVGIARLMDLLAQPLARRGELLPVLPGHFSSTRVPIHAVMLRERHRLPKIRACIDYWAQWLRDMAATRGTPP